MQSKVKLNVDHIKGMGVDIQRVLNGLRQMKAEMESNGCRVEITIMGEPLTQEKDAFAIKASSMKSQAAGSNKAKLKPDRCDMLTQDGNFNLIGAHLFLEGSHLEGSQGVIETAQNFITALIEFFKKGIDKAKIDIGVNDQLGRSESSIKFDDQAPLCDFSTQPYKFEENTQEKAGKETRTPDILLGKNSVMPEGEPVATPQACPDCGSYLVTICSPTTDVIIKLFGKGQTYFECGHCGNCWAVPQ